MSYPNQLYWDALEPRWVNLKYSQEPDDYIFVTNYGTKLTSQNGNNGKSANARLKGTAPGSFKISFKLGHTWGWSSFYAANIAGITSIESPAGGDFNRSGYNGMAFINNSSNNKLEISKGVNGTSTLLVDQTGVDNTIISFWRHTDNVVKFRVGSANPVTVGTYTDPWVFYSIVQSPASCEILTAHNNTRGAS